MAAGALVPLTTGALPAHAGMRGCATEGELTRATNYTFQVGDEYYGRRRAVIESIFGTTGTVEARSAATLRKRYRLCRGVDSHSDIVTITYVSLGPYWRLNRYDLS